MMQVQKKSYWSGFRMFAMATAMMVGAVSGGARADSGWSGAYAGVTLGASGVVGVVEDLDPADDDLDVDGAGGLSAGLVAGYNFMPFGASQNKGWLVGVEADIQSLDADDSEVNGVSGRVELDGSWVASARVRAGYAWERYNLYTTMGLAISDLEMRVENADEDTIDTDVGFVWGIGAEARFSDKINGRVEALSYGFSGDDVTVGGVQHDSAAGVFTLRAATTYHF